MMIETSAAGRAAVFASVRKSFGNLTQGQVDGIDAILDEAERRRIDVRWTAYMLATAWHETARHMQPVIETRGANETANPSVEEAIRRLETAWAAGKMPWVKTPYWRKDTKGLAWLGRGLPQMTHYANYRRLETATGIPLTVNPDLALEPAHAVTIMFAGMIGGLYTGRKLADDFNAARTDWRGARRIINAFEKADLVAGYARTFHAALKSAVEAAAAVAGRPVSSAMTSIVGGALHPPAPPSRGPSPAPARASSATKEKPMTPVPAINFGAGFADVFENLAHSIFTGGAAVESPNVDTRTSGGRPIADFGADIADAKRAGSEILEIVGDFRRRDLAGSADDAIDLARTVFGVLDRHGVKVPIVTDAIRSIDLDPAG